MMYKSLFGGCEFSDSERAAASFDERSEPREASPRATRNEKNFELVYCLQNYAKIFKRETRKSLN